MREEGEQVASNAREGDTEEGTEGRREGGIEGEREREREGWIEEWEGSSVVSS